MLGNARSSTAPINVRNFGATGDGIADDTAAFQKAFAHAAETMTTPTVSVPAGIHLISRTLDVADLRLIGA